MAEENDALEGMDDLEEMDALEAAVSGDDSGEEELDPLAEEMLKMMEEEGEGGGEEGGGEDVDQMMEMEMLKAMEEDGGGTPGADAALQVGTAGVGGGVPPEISRLMDVTLTVTIELGRTKSTIETVMEYSDQSLIELDKTIADPVDVLVNGELFARGEVVTVSENFGVRITELVNPITG